MEMEAEDPHYGMNELDAGREENSRRSLHCLIILWLVTGHILYFYYISNGSVEDCHDWPIEGEDNMIRHYVKMEEEGGDSFLRQYGGLCSPRSKIGTFRNH